MASTRELVPEVMDDPGLDRDLHEQALDGLRRLNAVSRSAATVWPMIRDAARRQDRPVRVLDLACGGGDVLLNLMQRAQASGVSLRLTGVDVSPVALDYAARAAAAADPGAMIDWVRGDALDPAALPIGSPEGFDVVMSNLFLHHLTEDESVTVLTAMRDAASPGGRVLVNDLCRSPLTQALVGLGCRALSRSPVVHVDGPRSARAAWTVAELRELADRAGLAGAVVRRRMPCRMLLDWSRP